MRELGGESIVLNSGDMQIGRGETIADTARVLSRYVSAIMLRTTAHDNLLELARHASVPVINALTDKTHPCQLMADIMTYEEHKGPIKGGRIAWLGDGNNVAASWIEAAARFGFQLNLACPAELPPDAGVLAWARQHRADVTLMKDPFEAAKNADCVVTDTWVSMGDSDAEERRRILRPYQVTQSIMDVADRKAIFMHDLPAHRGEEVVDQVIDGPQSVVFDEAENRLHAQKAILVWCLNGL
jgi:ornithine carbamoyltransferase